eukprot:4031466-Lingulodinium_polyedra.AAC.1
MGLVSIRASPSNADGDGSGLIHGSPRHGDLGARGPHYGLQCLAAGADEPPDVSRGHLSLDGLHALGVVTAGRYAPGPPRRKLSLQERAPLALAALLGVQAASLELQLL